MNGTGADPTIENGNGHTSLDYAKTTKMKNLLKNSITKVFELKLK